MLMLLSLLLPASQGVPLMKGWNSTWNHQMILVAINLKFTNSSPPPVCVSLYSKVVIGNVIPIGNNIEFRQNTKYTRMINDREDYVQYCINLAK